MEDRSRSFQTVKIGMTAVETGQERFYKDGHNGAPPVAFWRINLTALSQRYNLYFAATRDKVQVYRPEFPFQKLKATPSLTIIPQLSNLDAEGYINPDEPHNINHLVVGDLGNEEILLLSTDSGNVVAYHTRAINGACKKNAYDFSADANADFVGVRPFFSQWVHESAWGLAIHSEGRMIAVSANLPHHTEDSDTSSKITVFAFALISSDEAAEDSSSDVEMELATSKNSSEWDLWSTSNTSQYELPMRDRNYKIVLGGVNGHGNNIPCVNFVNGPEDTTGCWLLSTDITGQMKMWQVWAGKCIRTWNFVNQNEAATPWTRHRESGWLVAALDINAFRPADTMEKFIGHHRARQYYGYNAPGDSYDISEVVQRFTPWNSTTHPFVNDSEQDSPDEDGDELYGNVLDSEDERKNRPLSRRTEVDSELATLPSQSETRRGLENSSIAEYIDADSLMDIDYDEEDMTDEPSVDEPTEIEIMGDLSDEEDGDRSPSHDIDQSPNSSNSNTSDSSYNPTNVDEYEAGNYEDANKQTDLQRPSISSSRSIKTNTRATRPAIPRIPILHCSTSHTRLFSGPTAQTPHIFCARILRQTLPPGMENSAFSVSDRLNMLQQIPELGIVIIATQLGRCAVCSLTRRTGDGLLGFRVDYILPTKQQDRSGVRPASHVLLGIATSPIQGHTIPKAFRVSEHDPDYDWAQNRIIDGTTTTFDPDVVVLRPPAHGQVHSYRYPIFPTLPESVIIEDREWIKPKQIEKWRPFEDSRRYRLMLTYTDMTVLTYEISRGVEKEDTS